MGGRGGSEGVMRLSFKKRLAGVLGFKPALVVLVQTIC